MNVHDFVLSWYQRSLHTHYDAANFEPAREAYKCKFCEFCFISGYSRQIAHTQILLYYRQRMERKFSQTEIETIILMAWSDSTPFETITRLYGLSHDETVACMRRHQSAKTYIRWRQRTTKKHIGRSGKHEKLTAVRPRKQKFPV
jgi:uncharacterized protein (TIGR03643 family)